MPSAISSHSSQKCPLKPLKLESFKCGCGKVYYIKYGNLGKSYCDRKQYQVNWLPSNTKYLSRALEVKENHIKIYSLSTVGIEAVYLTALNASIQMFFCRFVEQSKARKLFLVAKQHSKMIPSWLEQKLCNQLREPWWEEQYHIHYRSLPFICCKFCTVLKDQK